MGAQTGLLCFASPPPLAVRLLIFDPMRHLRGLGLERRLALTLAVVLSLALSIDLTGSRQLY